MAVPERQNSAVHQTRVKQRGSRKKPEVATVSLAQEVFGGDRRTKTETERGQSNAGEFPQDVDAEHTSISRIQLSLSLAQYFLFKTFSTLNLNHYARISLFLFAV